MSIEQSAREGRRQVRRMGQQVTLTNFVEDEDTTRGTNYTESQDSPTQIWAIPDPGGESIDLDLWGPDVDYDIVFIVRDDVTGITDGGDNHASVIEHNGDTFVVNKSNDYLNAGQNVLACESDEE